MEYIIFVLLSVASACIIYFYCNYEGSLSTTVKFFPKKKVFDSDVKSLSQKNSIILISIITVVLFLAQWSLYKNTETIGFVKLYVLLLIVVCAGIIDFVRKIIPNILILFGLLFWVFITVYEFTNAEKFKNIIISELIGFAIGFVLLAVVYFITKGAIGFGDVKLFGIIGLISGAFCTYSTLLVSLLVSVVVSVIGMILKKVTRKDSIPFGPCVAIGYMVVIFLVSY